MMTTKRRRRIFAVTSSSQYKFLAMTLIYCFVIVCFFVIAILGSDVAEMLDKSQSLEIRSSAASRLLTKHAWIWPAVLSLTIVLALHSFHEFQKIVGPLYRFRLAFEQLEKGNLMSRLTLRDNDYLEKEEEAFNKMIKSFAEITAKINHATEDALKSIDELEQTANKGGEWSKTHGELLHAHRDHFERLSSAAQFFRLGDNGQQTDSAGSGA